MDYTALMTVTGHERTENPSGFHLITLLHTQAPSGRAKFYKTMYCEIPMPRVFPYQMGQYGTIRDNQPGVGKRYC